MHLGHNLRSCLVLSLVLNLSSGLQIKIGDCMVPDHGPFSGLGTLFSNSGPGPGTLRIQKPNPFIDQQISTTLIVFIKS